MSVASRETKITRMVNAMPKPETANTCGQCEYFDHGLADKATGHSDCLNRNSDRFQTYVSSAACNAFIQTPRMTQSGSKTQIWGHDDRNRDCKSVLSFGMRVRRSIFLA
jgi:hypothetical protein